jgi:N-ethylmaleimide reductase
VHAQASAIILQVMHAGRVTHRFNRSTDDPAIAPSAIASSGTIHTDQAGMQPYDQPLELSASGIAEVIEHYAAATRNAIAAGFDGVELHAAGCYLPAQFMNSSSNLRSDGYGGGVIGRIRFVVEVLDAMLAAAGHRIAVGIRISPGMEMAGVNDANPEALYTELIRTLAFRNLAYLHIMRVGGIVSGSVNFDVLTTMRQLFAGPIIAAGNLDFPEAQALIDAGVIDFAAFGRAFIANPDFASRLKAGIPLDAADPTTFYTAGLDGYI